MIKSTVASIMHTLAERPTGAPDETGIAPDFCGFSFISIDGQYAPLAAYLGKVVMVVNVASRCGFRGQYEGLMKLHRRYHEQGLVIVAVPCDDFGQEPGSTEEIKQFVLDRYQAEFPIMRKNSVKGLSAHPFFEWAKAKAEQAGLGNFITKTPRWNFHKYLIGRDGALIDSFSTLTAPHSAAMIAAIERALED